MSLRHILISVVFALSFSSCISRKIVEQDIFFPVKLTNLSGPLQLEEANFMTADGLQINAWFVKHPKARGTIIYCGGNGFNLHHHLTNQIINTLTRFNMNILLFDYRGYGKSEGAPTLVGILKDGDAAWQYLKSRSDVDSSRIVLYGHSLGTFVALHLGITSPVLAVVLQSPMTNAPEMKDALIRANVPWYARWFVRVDLDSTVLKLDNLTPISRLSVPLLIMSGEKDALTPIEMGNKLYKSAESQRKRFEVIPRADHDDFFFTHDIRKEQFHKIINEFFDSVLY